MGVFAVLSAFAAGLASFVSPCVLPLVPVYLAQLVGPTVWQGVAAPAEAQSRSHDDATPDDALAGAHQRPHDDPAPSPASPPAPDDPPCQADHTAQPPPRQADHTAQPPFRPTAVRLRSTRTTPRTTPAAPPPPSPHRPAPRPSPRRRTSWPQAPRRGFNRRPPSPGAPPSWPQAPRRAFNRLLAADHRPPAPGVAHALSAPLARRATALIERHRAGTPIAPPITAPPITAVASPLGRRATVTLHAAAFVAGFGLVFVALGASASAVGALLAAHEDALRRLGAVALALFGLHVAGVVRLPWLERERRFRLRTGTPGYLSSLGLGVVFGFGWTPCVGPYLAGILVLAAQARTLAAGVGLLVVYALGLGVPFLLVGVAFDRLVPALRRLSPHLGAIERASGALLLLLGVVLWFDWLPLLSSWFSLRV